MFLYAPEKNVYGQNAWIITISAEDYIHLYVTDHLDAVDTYGSILAYIQLLF